MTAAVGPTEQAYRAWVEQLGPLSERQAAEAEQIYVLAAQLDTARASGQVTSAVAGNSRELRQLAAGLRNVASPVPSPVVVAGTDEVQARRKARLRKQREATG